MDWKRCRIKFYERICRLRVIALLVFLGFTGISGLGAFVSFQKENWLLGSLCLVVAVPFLLGLSFLSWFFPTLRFIRWWITRQFHRSSRWLARPGLLLAGVALVVLVAWSLNLAGTLKPGLRNIILKEEGRTMLIPQNGAAEATPVWERSLQLGLELLALGVLVALLREMGKARSRIVIQPFVDHTAGPGVRDEVRKARGEALSSLLRSEIAGITSLYKIIDEVSPSKTSVEATVGVADVGERLKEAIGPDSKLKLLGVEIPVGSVATMISWLVRGPRLIGSLHKEGDHSFVLLVEAEGGGVSGNWRVHLQDLEAEDRDIDAPSPTADEPPPAVETRLIRQMTYRIVTQLLSVGSPRWQAVRHYTEGLRYYRDTQRTSRDKVLNLRKAERAFIRALGHDQKFAQCHYNLGVVYRELDRPDSSEAAFRQAMQESPRSFEAAYAMAQKRFDEKKYDATLDCVDHAIGLCPEEARAWNLKGWALRRALEEGQHIQYELSAPPLKKPGAPLPPGNQWEDIRWLREVAAALAWRALCRALRTSDQPEPQSWIAAASTVNSGIPYCFLQQPRRADQRFWQAIHLYRDTTVLRFEMGKAYCQAGKWQKASDVLESIFSYSIDSVDLAELLLYRLAANDMLCKDGQLKKYDYKAEHDYERLLGLACCAAQERKTLAAGLEAIDRICSKRRREGSWIDRLNLALYLIEALPAPRTIPPHHPSLSKWIIHRLENLHTTEVGEDVWSEILTEVRQRMPMMIVPLNQHRLYKAAERFDWFWFRAVARIRHAEELLAVDGRTDRRNAEKAVEELRAACYDLQRSRHSHSFQIRKQGVYRLLTEALQAQSQGKPVLAALEKAVQAVLLEPEGAAERLTLGRVYASFMDFEQARDELRTSWQLKPETEVLKEIASTGWKHETSRLNPKTRKEELQRLAGILQKGLHIAECGANEAGANAIDHGTIHYWLGRYRGELLEYDAAIYNLRIARAMGFKPLETCLLIGQLCLEANAYDEAERAFRNGLIEAGKQLRGLEAGARSDQESRQERRVRLAQKPARAAGEERPIFDLKIELLLGWALTLAERRSSLKRARNLTRLAESQISRRGRAHKRHQLALLQETRGCLRFQDRDWTGAIGALKRSLDLQPSASAYLRLARAYMEMGLQISDLPTRDVNLALARDAARIAECMDLRRSLKGPLEEVRTFLRGQLAPAQPGLDSEAGGLPEGRTGSPGWADGPTDLRPQVPRFKHYPPRGRDAVRPGAEHL